MKSIWSAWSKNQLDRLFSSILLTFCLVIILIVGTIVYELVSRSALAILHFGFHFLTGQVWDPVHQVFGALPFIYGTVVSSVIGVILASIVGIATAILLTQYGSWRWLDLISILVELLAAIPSVVYGLWGIFILAPWLRQSVEPILNRGLGFLPLFQGQGYGVGMLAAGIILAVMILPTITAVVRDVMQAVPNELKDGALALGATKQEMVSLAILPQAKRGILGAIMLALGRALGETMAVTMVIGNRPQIAASLFAPGYSMASVIANEFTEATSKLYESSLYEIGLVLFLLTVVFYSLARLLVWRIRLQMRVNA